MRRYLAAAKAVARTLLRPPRAGLGARDAVSRLAHEGFAVGLATVLVLGPCVEAVTASPPGAGLRRVAFDPAPVGPPTTTVGRPDLEPSDTGSATRLSDALRTLPLYFVENRGQSDPRVAYYVQGVDTSVYFTREGITFSLAGPDRSRTSEPAEPGRVAHLRRGGPTRERWTVKLDFVGPNPEVRPTGEDATAAVVSHFRGDPRDWKTGLPTYGRVVYANLWPGIDLVCTGTGGQLKYTFVVRPGGDPKQIRLAYRGASGVRTDDAGRLIVSTPVGALEEDTPYVYQEAEGERVEVEGAYALEAEASDAHRFGFRLGAYDPGKPLFVDPVVLNYCGYIGGSLTDAGHDVAVDGAGNLYVTGYTASTEATFPVASGPDSTYNGGGTDAYVAKVNPGGTALVYLGYIGGAGDDYAWDVAVDDLGNAYVVGITGSTEATFPATVGPDLTYNGGPNDAFVAKLGAAGTTLEYCGYIGGAGDDYGVGLAVDGLGNAYVVGYTGSTQSTFPETVGPDLTFNGGTQDVFVAKVDAAGAVLVYCGYIGGSGNETAYDIAVDRNGNAYATGQTESTQFAFFPVSVGPGVSYNGGASDAFVAKVNAGGTGLVYCGYVGGSGDDYGRGVAVDASGNAYLSGYTSSTEATFPLTVGPDLTYNGGGYDAFVAKVNGSGTALVYCGYVGGSGSDFGYDVAADSLGNAYVTGATASPASTFPVARGPDSTYNGGPNDAFIAKVHVTGAALVYCGYIGGSAEDIGWGVEVDGSGNAYVTGSTLSTQTSFPVTAGPDPTHGGGGVPDAFVAKITDRPTVVSYSVGTSTADLKLGAPAITISSGTATFSASQPGHVGVGDRVVYSGSTVAYISGRTSPTTYSMISATGANPPDISGAPVDSIRRAFNSLSAAEAGSGDALHLNTTDLVSADVQLHWPCYDDGPLDDRLTLSGWTTGPANYIRIYSPYLPSQAGARQRHTGVAGTGFRLAPVSASAAAGAVLGIDEEYVRVEGIEIDGRGLTNAPDIHGIHAAGTLSTASDVRIDGNIVHGLHDITSGPAYQMGIWIDSTPGGTGATARISNNVVYDVTSINFDVVGISVWSPTTSYVYSNTVYHIRQLNTGAPNGAAWGIQALARPACGCSVTVLAKNNYVGDVSADADVEFCYGQQNPGATLDRQSNVSSDATGNIAGQSSYAAYFVDAASASADLHLSNDSIALWGSFGLDLDTDPDLPVKTDFEGAARDPAQPDIGADEFGATTEVDLLSFAAAGLDKAVELRWETASETNNLGFYLYRREGGAGPFELITPSPIPGLGSSPVGARYRYVDHGVANGRTYYYLLEDYETTGKTRRHGPVSATPHPGASPPDGGAEPDPDREAPSPDGGAEPEPDPVPGPARVTYGDPDATSLRVLRRTRRGLLLELTTGGFHAEPQGDGSVRLSIPGFTEENSPGSPAIPTRRAWVEAMAGRRVRLASVRALDVVGFSGLRPLAAEARELVASRSGALRLGKRRQAEGRLFRRRGLHPGEAARLLETAFQGEVKKARLELAPLRWDARSGRLLLARRLQVRLSFRGAEPDEHSSGGVARGRRYRRSRSHGSRGVIARLSTEQRGLYAVRYEDVAVGRRGLDASRLLLRRQGSPVAYHLEPDPGRFGPGSSLYFFSEGASVNPYGPRAVYELELGGQPGLSMPTARAAPAGALLDHHVHRGEHEENLAFWTQLQIENPWLWASILASTSKSFAFEASRVVPGPETALLELRLLGVANTQDAVEHRVRLFLNGHLVAEPTWTSTSMESLAVELSPTLILEGSNTLTIENANSFYSAVMVDRFALSYPRLSVSEAGVLEGRFTSSGTASIGGLTTTPRVLDLSSPTPRWLSGVQCTPGHCRFAAEAGHSYLVAQAPLRPSVELAAPSRLKETANQYDYLVIGPRALLDAARPLVEQRRSQGLSSLAVPIEEVYGEFGFGEPLPQAIRDFLTYAFHKWAPPAPRYVLLLGDGSYDYKDYLGSGAGNPVPPLLFRSSFIWTASDPLYAAVNGEDALPDLALGRLPASTPEEAGTMVDKILAFEDAGLSLDGAAVLVSDNPDAAGNFDAEADEIAATLLAARHPSRVALAKLGVDATRAAILDAFGQGPSLLSYIGHGSQQLWAHENIFNASQVSSLTPQPQPPFVLTMNCLNGYFHYPYYDSLSEELVKAESKGAIAAFSPSGLSFNDAAHLFHKAFLAELTRNDHARLGDALLAAQAAYADTGASAEMIDIYHLLGDPALRIR